VKENNELQEARSLEKQMESTREPEETRPKNLRPKVGTKAKRSPVAEPWEEKQMQPEDPRTSSTGAHRRQLHTGGSHVIFLKTSHHRTPMGDMKLLDVTDKSIWFEGLPTRIHLPGPRIMCRSSNLRWVKRCCTRFCSASLELSMCHP
jgi:hypothetical protein